MLCIVEKYGTYDSLTGEWHYVEITPDRVSTQHTAQLLLLSNSVSLADKHDALRPLIGRLYLSEYKPITVDDVEHVEWLKLVYDRDDPPTSAIVHAVIKNIENSFP